MSCVHCGLVSLLYFFELGSITRSQHLFGPAGTGYLRATAPPHSEFIAGLRQPALESLAQTLCLAVMLVCFQYIEYRYSSLHINDSVHGSAFYLITGFHGFHVLIGTLFIFSCFLRVVEGINTSFTAEHHFFFVAALWYWHFVDVVWVFVFIFLYLSLGC